jgi:hypothetical protein
MAREPGVQTLLPAKEVVEQWERSECGVVELEFAASGLAVYLLAVRVLEAFDEVEEDSVFETAGAIGEIDVLCINGLRSNKEILKRMGYSRGYFVSCAH